MIPEERNERREERHAEKSQISERKLRFSPPLPDGGLGSDLFIDILCRVRPLSGRPELGSRRRRGVRGDDIEGGGKGMGHICDPGPGSPVG